MSPLPADQLIELVKKYPALYDQHHEDFRNKVMRNMLWRKIATEMNVHVDANVVKRKWKGLRSSYRQYLKANLQSPTKINYYRYWLWAKQMEYFKPYIWPIKTSDYSNNATTATDTEVILIESDSSEASTTFETKIEVYECPEFVEDERPTEEEKPVEETITRMYKKRERSQSPVADGRSDYLLKRQRFCLTPIETAFLGYARKVGKFSLKKQATTKMKIAQIIMEQELLAIEEADVDHFVVNAD